VIVAVGHPPVVMLGNTLLMFFSDLVDIAGTMVEPLYSQLLGAWFIADCPRGVVVAVGHRSVVIFDNALLMFISVLISLAGMLLELGTIV